MKRSSELRILPCGFHFYGNKPRSEIVIVHFPRHAPQVYTRTEDYRQGFRRVNNRVNNVRSFSRPFVIVDGTSRTSRTPAARGKPKAADNGRL
jgi:hypothetical protein